MNRAGLRVQFSDCNIDCGFYLGKLALLNTLNLPNNLIECRVCIALIGPNYPLQNCSTNIMIRSCPFSCADEEPLIVLKYYHH